MREIPYRHESGQLPPTLQRIPFLQQLDTPLLDGLLAHSVLLECDRGDEIIAEGDETKFLCILLKGMVDVTKGGQRVAQVDGAGEVLGELALLNDTERSASVVAAGHVFCLKVEPAFLGEMDGAQKAAFYAVLYRFVVSVLSERLDTCSQRLAEREDELAQIKSGKFKL